MQFDVPAWVECAVLKQKKIHDSSYQNRQNCRWQGI